jgi:iron-sulfur cluster insertion protein
MITLTETAKNRINDILYDLGNPDSAIRISVQGGGCSGFQYKFTMEDTVNEDDITLHTDPFKILIDSMSIMYMNDAVIDYQESLMNSQFVIQNPHAQSHCGCGSSFSVG